MGRRAGCSADVSTCRARSQSRSQPGRPKRQHVAEGKRVSHLLQTEPGVMFVRAGIGSVKADRQLET